MRDLLHRIGTVEIAAAEARGEAKAAAAQVQDHETRIRRLENLTAKVVGGSILGGMAASFLAWLINFLK